MHLYYYPIHAHSNFFLPLHVKIYVHISNFLPFVRHSVMASLLFVTTYSTQILFFPNPHSHKCDKFHFLVTKHTKQVFFFIISFHTHFVLFVFIFLHLYNYTYLFSLYILTFHHILYISLIFIYKKH